MNETNTTLTFAQSDVVLGLALIFCILFLLVGFKDKTFWVIAGPVWIISGLTVFMDYDEWFMLLGIGIGLVLIFWGAYDALA